MRRFCANEGAWCHLWFPEKCWWYIFLQHKLLRNIISLLHTQTVCVSHIRFCVLKCYFLKPHAGLDQCDYEERDVRTVNGGIASLNLREVSKNMAQILVASRQRRRWHFGRISTSLRISGFDYAGNCIKLMKAAKHNATHCQTILRTVASLFWNDYVINSLWPCFYFFF